MCLRVQMTVINRYLRYHRCQTYTVFADKHDDVIKWKHFPRYWPFVRGIHRSPVNSPHKGQWRGALMFTLICPRINGWVNNCKAGDLRRNCAHYDVTVMNRFPKPRLSKIIAFSLAGWGLCNLWRMKVENSGQKTHKSLTIILSHTVYISCVNMYHAFVKIPSTCRYAYDVWTFNVTLRITSLECCAIMYETQVEWTNSITKNSSTFFNQPNFEPRP